MIPDPDPLRSAAAAEPDAVAVIDRVAGERLRYDELDARVHNLAAGLDTAGVRPGDRVVVAGRLATGTFELVHAVRRCGGIVVPISPELSAERLDDRLEIVDPTVVVAVDEQWADRPDARTIGTLRDHGEGSTGAPPVSPRGPGDAVAILFTSGTTGRPKAVRLTAHNVAASAIASAFRLGVRTDDRWLCCLEPHRMGGFAPILRTATYGTGAIIQPVDPDGISLAIRTDRATGISVVPIMLRRLLAAGVPLDALRVVLVGGARTPPALVERALAADVPLHVSYGGTETASHVCAARPAELAGHPGTVGRPLRWTDISVVDDSGDPVPAGAEGELVVRGPTVSPGYVDGGDENRLVGDGTFRSGDRGYIDPDGRVFVTGRADDRIVTGAVVVDPRVVERALTDHPAVLEAAVVGREDPEWGERVCALLAAEAPARVDPDGVIEFVADELSTAELPRDVDVVAALPRTASGTVDRARVRAHFEP